MPRKIIRIDREKCDGCGQCVTACAEGAIEIVNGKAELVSESYCDGLGACIGECPTGALVIEEREAEAFDAQAVKRRMEDMKNRQGKAPSCPSSVCPGAALQHPAAERGGSREASKAPSALSTWPVQLRLVPPVAPFLRGADLLICADCVPFAVADFHRRYLEGRVVLVGCPKFDDLPAYAERMASIISEAKPASVTILRMEVPCCAGLATVTLNAVRNLSPETPLEIHTVGIGGKIERDVIDVITAERQPADSAE